MSVRDYIRAELERSTSGIDTHTLADNVVRTIPDDELDAVIHELMWMAVQLFNKASGRTPAMTMAQPATLTAAPGPTPKVGQSKWATLAPYRAMLNRSQAIDGRLYRLGDLTVDLLRRSASSRRVQADTMVRNAEWYEKIAAALEEHDVDTVDELPDEVLEALHEAVAA